jgi:hypothetical protein
LQAPDSPIAGMDRHFPAPSYTETDTGGYAAGVLSQNIYSRRVGDFGPKGAPVERYELSGYGASLFSDWRDQSSIGPAITQHFPNSWGGELVVSSTLSCGRIKRRCE